MAALPSFIRARKRNTEKRSSSSSSSLSPSSPETETASHHSNDIKRATRNRRNAIIIASAFYFLSIIFLILVEIGNTANKPVLRDMYFYKLDLTDIIPASVPNAVLINSIARSLGLHDFYQVGVWNFCEGYNDEGITYCSTPQKLYWFNPVEVLTNELLAGASIALPNAVNDILTLVRIASQCMFGFFMACIVVNLVLMVAGPVAVFSRWWSLPFGLLSFISSMLIVAASGVATAMSVIFRWALTQQSDLNIRAYVGVRMMVFMWIASVFTIIATLIHSGAGCFCASRRDVKTGRKSLFMDRSHFLPHYHHQQRNEAAGGAQEEEKNEGSS